MDKIPSWLFFSLLPSMKMKDWTEEKDKTAKYILKNLKEKARQHDKDIDFLLKYDKNDDLNGYYM